ncbi:MAG TPA: hypothetical protein VF805_03315 [Anaeromyxobacteraceae bacterium]
MTRPSWRQRSDGVYEILRKGRVERALLALGAALLAVATTLAALSARAVYLIAALPFAVAGGVLLLLRRARRRSAQAAAPAATVLSLDRRSAAGHAAARDAGA